MSCLRRTWFRGARMACLAAFGALLSPGLVAQAPDDGLIEELPIESADDTGLAALQADFDAAMELFNSVRQADSIALLSNLIDEVSANAEPLGSEQRDLLTAALFRRAEAQLNLGENAAAAADLETAARVEIGFQPNPARVSPKLIDLFEQARSRVGGYLLVEFDPPDAVLVSGDTKLAPSPGVPLPLLTGAYRFSVERPGFTSMSLDVEVGAGETIPVEATLERVSAVVRVRTEQPEVEVVVDGQSRGTTAVEALAGPSEPVADDGEEALPRMEQPQLAELSVDGLAVGQHVLELRKEGFRSGRAELSVESLTDYEMDAISLEETRGTLLVSGIPAEAAMSVDGELLFPAGTVKGEINFPLSVGDHLLEVDAGDLGGFVHQFGLEDRGEHSVEVRLMPRLTLVGVLGGDPEAADRVHRSLTEQFADHPSWLMLDRVADVQPRLIELGSALDRIRQRDFEAVDWSGVQGFIGGETVGSVYLLAVLSDDLLASSADLLMLPSAQSAALIDVARVELNDPDSVEQWARRFDAGPAWARPWLGVDFLDSPLAEGPVVVNVDPTGPAATAGFQPGDVVVSVGNSPTPTAQAVEQAMAVIEPGASAPIVVRRGDSNIELRIDAVAADRVAVDLDSSSSRSATAAWLTIAGARGAIDDWLLALDRAAVYRAAGAWSEVVRALRAAGGPEEPGLGKAAVDYWLGVALLETDPVGYLQQARDALERAERIPGARLSSSDGPLIAPRAASRLRALELP